MVKDIIQEAGETYLIGRKEITMDILNIYIVHLCQQIHY